MNEFRNIKDTYKIETTLGKGNFATVKRCKNRQTGEKYAVKVMSKTKITDEVRQAILNEIDILKQIDHPNIVKLIDVFEDERHFCLVMELMTGGELFDLIVQKDHFSEAEARDAVRSLVDALDYCHKLGILHRDIKPENLLLQSQELGLASLKIADFGLARSLDEGVMASTVCGTPGYVAPEVLKQKPYGKECDWWSIGVVTYIMLSGTPPFYEEDNFALFEQIKKCQYDFDEEQWGGVSKEAKDFISKILVPEPSNRLNLEQMLQHPWMKVDLDSKKNLASQANQKLKKYQVGQKQKSSLKAGTEEEI